MMRAVVRSAYGSPDVIELEDIPRPALTDDAVLVRVRAASVNGGDLDYLYGRPLIARAGTGLRRPTNRGLGLDAAGQVEAVGSKVTEFRPGDKVFGDLTEHGFGAFAEYISAPEQALAHMPAGMTFEQAATIPQAATTALQALRGRRPIAPGDSVLINGASGSVGPFAVQIAKALGAEVTGVCSAAKMDMVRALGADHVIDYAQGDFTRGAARYDRILDLKARRSILACRRALKPSGVYVWGGGSTVRFLEALLVGPLISLAGSRTMGLMWWWKPFKDQVAALTGLIEAGTVAPLIDRRYPLRQVPDALRYVERGRARGKVVITI